MEQLRWQVPLSLFYSLNAYISMPTLKKKKNIFKLLKGIRKKLKDTGAADSAFDSTCSCKNPSSVPTSSDS